MQKDGFLNAANETENGYDRAGAVQMLWTSSTM